jgi:hypothetical protein
MCKWVMLPDKDDPAERRCPAPGEPYCAEHDVELHYDVWLELRDLAAFSSQEEKVRRRGKLLRFSSRSALGL